MRVNYLLFVVANATKNKKQKKNNPACFHYLKNNVNLRSVGSSTPLWATINLIIIIIFTIIIPIIIKITNILRIIHFFLFSIDCYDYFFFFIISKYLID